MGRIFKLSGLCAFALALAGRPASGQELISYTGTGSHTGGASGALNIGRQFTVSGPGITIDDLGIYDDGSNGLAASHTVTLFTINSGAGAANASVTAIAGGSLVIPSGTTATLEDGLRFTALATPLYLAPGNYSLIGYGFNSSGDPYGDVDNDTVGLPTGPDVTDIDFDPYQFTSNTSPSYPNSGDTNDHTSVSFLYVVGAVPEPPEILLLALPLAALAWRFRRRRAAAP